MAVVVQRMVFPDAAGVLFTADPVTSNRKVACVEAGLGLGEALVAGLVERGHLQGTGRRDHRQGSRDQAACRPRLAGRRDTGAGDRAGASGAAGADRCAGGAACPAGPADRGTLRPPPGHRVVPGRRWVPDRPEPADHHSLPHPVTDDGGNHVFVSVGHGQMMTDAMKPLGISMWQLTALPRMYEAGGRLFVDVTQRLASPTGRASLLEVIGRGDPLIRDALRDHPRTRRLHPVASGRGSRAVRRPAALPPRSRPIRPSSPS